MSYIDRIDTLVTKINPELVDFSLPRKRPTSPTQVSSQFLTNKEQGEWAELTFMNGINQCSSQYVAVKYGRDDDIVAGEDGFKEFFNNYQNELDIIGKRPDLLVFKKEDFNFDTLNISKFDEETLDSLVPKAICGIEVRSSAFLIEKYEQYMYDRQNSLTNQIFSIKDKILVQHGERLKSNNPALYRIIESLETSNIRVIDYRCPSWKSSKELCELTALLKELKLMLKELSKRDFLNITPKVEDLKVVYNWIKRYNVPHYYVQVFFDKAYGISFEKILNLLGNPDLEGKEFFIEGDVKNQNKLTIKIHANTEENVLKRISLPEHYSEMKELERGRLLFFVKYKDSTSSLNLQAFEKLFGFKLC